MLVRKIYRTSLDNIFISIKQRKTCDKDREDKDLYFVHINRSYLWIVTSIDFAIVSSVMTASTGKQQSPRSPGRVLLDITRELRIAQPIAIGTPTIESRATIERSTAWACQGRSERRPPRRSRKDLSKRVTTGRVRSCFPDDACRALADFQISLSPDVGTDISRKYDRRALPQVVASYCLKNTWSVCARRVWTSSWNV